MWSRDQLSTNHSSPGGQVLHGDLHTAEQLVADLPRGGVQRLLDELPQPAPVLHLAPPITGQCWVT